MDASAESAGSNPVRRKDLYQQEQLEEVASMGQLLRVVPRAGEGNLLRVEEYLARENDSGVALSEEE